MDVRARAAGGGGERCAASPALQRPPPPPSPAHTPTLTQRPTPPPGGPQGKAGGPHAAHRDAEPRGARAPPRRRAARARQCPSRTPRRAAHPAPAPRAPPSTASPPSSTSATPPWAPTSTSSPPAATATASSTSPRWRRRSTPSRVGGRGQAVGAVVGARRRPPPARGAIALGPRPGRCRVPGRLDCLHQNAPAPLPPPPAPQASSGTRRSPRAVRCSRRAEPPPCSFWHCAWRGAAARCCEDPPPRPASRPPRVWHGGGAAHAGRGARGPVVRQQVRRRGTVRARARARPRPARLPSRRALLRVGLRRPSSYLPPPPPPLPPPRAGTRPTSRPARSRSWRTSSTQRPPYSPRASRCARVCVCWGGGVGARRGCAAACTCPSAARGVGPR